MLRIAFLGTGKLALPVFTALCESSHQIVGLVTQPDRTGRGHHQHLNPLKVLAESRAIPVFQPEKLRTPESVATLRSWQADLFVVAAYGQILSNDVLEMPRLGCINVHASLLPKYRGATPIHAAILNGDTESGVTIIRLVQKLDAGDMLGVARTPIGANETTGELETRLAELSVPLTLQVIGELAAGTVRPVAQEESRATHVGKLSKENGWIPWGKSSRAVECHIRGMQPWPGAFTTLVESNRPPIRLKILKGIALEGAVNSTPGVVERIDASRPGVIQIMCGSGAILLQEIQPDGKRPMAVAEYLRGHSIQPGDRFVSGDPGAVEA